MSCLSTTVFITKLENSLRRGCHRCPIVAEKVPDPKVCRVFRKNGNVQEIVKEEERVTYFLRYTHDPGVSLL